MTQSPTHNDLPLIGRAERIIFSGHSNQLVPAKIDTGADSSSVWASDVSEAGDMLNFRLFGPDSRYYTGEVITLAAGQYKRMRIANSFGHKEVRYVVELTITVRGQTVTSSFSLADRSTKAYPVLLGRKLLEGQFLVDVTQGEPLTEAELQELAKKHIELTESEV